MTPKEERAQPRRCQPQRDWTPSTRQRFRCSKQVQHARTLLWLCLTVQTNTQTPPPPFINLASAFHLSFPSRRTDIRFRLGLYRPEDSRLLIISTYPATLPRQPDLSLCIIVLHSLDTLCSGDRQRIEYRDRIGVHLDNMAPYMLSKRQCDGGFADDGSCDTSGSDDFWWSGVC